MKHSLRTGLSFGLTSGVITTLGLVVGLYAGTRSRLAVLGGIVTIAIADAMSDALGIHVSEESREGGSSREVWESTLSTFAFKFLVALTFLVPVLSLPAGQAVAASAAWGLGLVALMSYFVAEGDRWAAVLEHLAIAVAVILATHSVGGLVSALFS